MYIYCYVALLVDCDCQGQELLEGSVSVEKRSFIIVYNEDEGGPMPCLSNIPVGNVRKSVGRHHQRLMDKTTDNLSEESALFMPFSQQQE